MTLENNRRFAIGFAVAVSVLQFARSICFGAPMKSMLVLPIAADAYVMSALLVAGAWTAHKNGRARALLIAGWGFACGIMYRTTLEQLADPARHAGHESLVMVFKGILFALAIAGFIGAIMSERGARDEARSM